MTEGTVVTFYSYKGGVGRTFVMANLAAVLAAWGYRVLCIDWDLEAPGLTHYFADHIESPQLGLVEFIEAFTADGNADWQRYVIPANIPSLKGQLDLIAAGGKRSDYITRVQNIRWSDLYDRGFGAFLEKTRSGWKEKYDFVMIDSRTGITDIGGICTAQLPDILVAVLVANQQNVDGIEEVVQRARLARDRLPYDRGVLLVLPLVSRFDARVEYRFGQEWLNRLTQALSPLYANWLMSNVVPRDIIDRTTIPYLSIWAFGEHLPVLSESAGSPEYISYSLETLAALIGQRLANTALLTESRDAYVATARRAAVQRGRFQYDLIISAPMDDAKLASALAKELTQRGINCSVAYTDDAKVLEELLTRSQHMLALFNGREADVSRAEVQQFLKQAIDDKSERMVFPVLAGGAAPDQLPPLLRNHRMLLLRNDNFAELADRLSELLALEDDRKSSISLVSARLQPQRLAILRFHLRPFGVALAFTVAALVCASIEYILTGGVRGILPPFAGAARTVLELSGWRAVVSGVVPLSVMAYYFGMTEYRVLDRALATPLFRYEQIIPFLTNIVVMTVLYVIVFGSGVGIGAILYGILAAAVMSLKLADTYWSA